MAVDEDDALNRAIIDAAKLEYKQHSELAVESILVDNNFEESDSRNKLDNLNTSEKETLDTSKDVTTVSTLIVSERKYSGTESVQINEKLINREN